MEVYIQIYTVVILPKVEAPLGEETYNPFDFPKIPYEEGGVLNLLIGQGAYGDYNGGGVRPCITRLMKE